MLSQDVDSLSARLSGSAPLSLDSAQRLAKEVGVLIDVCINTHDALLCDPAPRLTGHR